MDNFTPATRNQQVAQRQKPKTLSRRARLMSRILCPPGLGLVIAANALILVAEIHAAQKDPMNWLVVAGVSAIISLAAYKLAMELRTGRPQKHDDVM